MFKRMWNAGLAEYDEVKGIDWKWQAVDGAMTKAPLGGDLTDPNPTDRGKSGTKRSLLVDGKGVPLSIVVGPAQGADSKLLAPTLENIVFVQPESSRQSPQNLCLDKSYTGQPTQETGAKHGYEIHIPDKVNAKQKRKRKPGRRKARRWVVEVAHSWLNRFRRLQIRWEKKRSNYLSLLYFACAIICWRKCEV